MDSDLTLDFNKDFVFMKDKDGNLQCGGFTVNNSLLASTINDSNDIQKGGNKNTLAQLKDLGLPAGLVYNNSYNTKRSGTNYENTNEILDENIYDKLLDLVDIKNKKKFAIKSNKKREKKKNVSRRKK
jgi:hypothetical protein